MFQVGWNSHKFILPTLTFIYIHWVKRNYAGDRWDHPIKEISWKNETYVGDRWDNVLGCSFKLVPLAHTKLHTCRSSFKEKCSCQMTEVLTRIDMNQHSTNSITSVHSWLATYIWSRPSSIAPLLPLRSAYSETEYFLFVWRH